MTTLIEWLQHAGLPLLFVAVLVEQAGLPLPSYPLLIVAGAWSTQGGAAPMQSIAVAAAAALVADLGWYGAGRRFGSRVLRTMCRLTLSPDSCVFDTERLFARFGTRALLFAKFVPGLGAVATAMSGVVRARLERFVAYDLAGAFLWAASGVVLGALFRDAIDGVLSALSALGRWGLALVGLALAVFLIFKLWRRRQFFRELRMARISVTELWELIEQGAAPMVVDARNSASRDRDGIIPGAIAFESLVIDTGAGGTPRPGEVVVYCACPNEASAARIAKQLMRRGFTRVRPLAGGIHAWRDAGFDVMRP